MDATNRAWVLRFVLLVFFGLVSCSPKLSHGADNLAVGILADPREYGMSDVLRLDTRLENRGASTCYIFQDMCWDPKNHLNIHVLDLSGKEVTGHAGIWDLAISRRSIRRKPIRLRPLRSASPQPSDARSRAHGERLRPTRSRSPHSVCPQGRPVKLRQVVRLESSRARINRSQCPIESEKSRCAFQG
jgi:hypothetical protein